jgi:hypothetical protein
LCHRQAEKCGIACVVPPPSFRPPFALDRGTNGMNADSFRFAIRKQLTSHLCMRLANRPKVLLSVPAQWPSRNSGLLGVALRQKHGLTLIVTLAHF